MSLKSHILTSKCSRIVYKTTIEGLKVNFYNIPWNNFYVVIRNIRANLVYRNYLCYDTIQFKFQNSIEHFYQKAIRNAFLITSNWFFLHMTLWKFTLRPFGIQINETTHVTILFCGIQTVGILMPCNLES